MGGQGKWGRLALTLLILWADVPPSVLADDAPAPVLQVREDPPPPRPSLTLTADPLRVAFGWYGAEVEVALGRWNGLAVGAAWARQGGPAFELSYHLWPLGRGLSGPFVGPVVGVVLAATAAAWREVWLGGELGYQHAWSPFVLGVAAGGVARWSAVAGPGGPAVRLRLKVGWSW
jgi:hypothetical protein